MTQQEWIEQCKATILDSSKIWFGSTDNGQDYIVECEHQDGVEYWEQFKSLNDLNKDFWAYCEAAELITK